MLVRLCQAGRDSAIDPVSDPLHHSFAPLLGHQVPFFNTPVFPHTGPSTTITILDPELILEVSFFRTWSSILTAITNNKFKNMVTKSWISYLFICFQILPDDVDIQLLHNELFIQLMAFATSFHPFAKRKDLFRQNMRVDRPPDGWASSTLGSESK